MDRRLLYCRMRRLSNEAARSRAIRDSDQRSATPYLPLPMARTGVPADEGRTALPIFQTGTRRQGVPCGSAPTLYSSQVQQQARIPAHYGEPLRTNERWLTCASAAVRVNLPVSGGQGSRVQIPPSRLVREFFGLNFREPTGEPMGSRSGAKVPSPGGR